MHGWTMALQQVASTALSAYVLGTRLGRHQNRHTCSLATDRKPERKTRRTSRRTRTMKLLADHNRARPSKHGTLVLEPGMHYHVEMLGVFEGQGLKVACSSIWVKNLECPFVMCRLL